MGYNGPLLGAIVGEEMRVVNQKAIEAATSADEVNVAAIRARNIAPAITPLHTRRTSPDTSSRHARQW